MVFCLILVAAVLGFFGYRHWEKYAMQRQAHQVIEEARLLLQELQKEGEAQFAQEYNNAMTSFEEARASYQKADFAEALGSGRRSLALLTSIYNALRDEAGGDAHFISVLGRVEFRRGEHGSWQQARSREALKIGDWVKTSDNGSAEVMFIDGTLFNVRPNTLFLVSRSRPGAGVNTGEQTIAMEYGWVDLNTSARRGSKVTTPGAEAQVREQSEVSVAYEKDTETGRFASYTGGMQVASEGGMVRDLGALQMVEQQGVVLSEPRPLPPAPQLLGPVENAELKLGRDEQVALSWTTVQGASGYALQVARSELFVDNIIDVEGRTRNRATLGILGSGTFLWRVRALGEDNLPGQWSPPRKLRVAPPGGLSAGAQGDTEPPDLNLADVQGYGSIYIISGTTEPGATVQIQGEPVKVDAGGSFTKTVQLSDTGWSFVEVRAVDASGNETVKPLRLYADSL